MARYYKSTATVWNLASSWSATSSTATDNAGIPSTTDDVIFDATSGATCAVSTSGAILIGNCRNFTTTGYTGTITLNVDLNIYGPTIIIGNTTSFLGAAWFSISGANPSVARTMNSNGVYFPNFQLGVGGAILNAITFNDVLNVGNIRQGASNGITTNGSSVNVNGSMTMEATGYNWLGTTVYNLVGTGNFGMTSTSPFFGVAININTSGTITFLSLVKTAGITLTYIAGNVDTTTNSSLLDLYFNNTITSKNTSTLNEIIFNNVRAGATGTLGTTTLGSDMRVGGNFTVFAFNGYNFNGNTIYVRGNINNPVGVPNGGTSVMVMEGSVAATISGGTLSRSLTIGKSGGAVVTVVVSGAAGLNWGGAGLTLLVPASQTLALSTTLTLGAGTFDCSAGTFTPNLQTVNLLQVTRSINMGNTNKFYNLTFTANNPGCVVTMLSKIDVTNDLLLSNSVNFNGAFDITVDGNLSTATGTLENSTPGRKLILTGLSTGVSTIISFNTASIILEINCVGRGFALTGTLSPFILNYLATNIGSFTTTGSTLSHLNNPSINMFGSTNSWNIISQTSLPTRIMTLLSNVHCVQLGPTANGDTFNSSGGSFFIIATGNTGTLSNISGTAGLRFEGSSNSTWNQGATTSNSLRTIEFAKTAPGTVSIPNSFTYGGILKYISGAVTHASTLTLNTGTTVDTTNAVSWNNITIPTSATITINSLLLINGNLTINGTATFAGACGWDCNNLISTAAGTFNIILQQLIEYRTRLAVSITGGIATSARTTMISSDATNLAIWTLDPGATQTLIYVNGTRIDSSLGQTVWTFGGIIGATTKNWNVGTRPGTSAYTFVN